MHPYPNHYLLYMLEDQNKQAGQPLQQQKSPPLPRGPQVECSKDSSRAAIEETRKFPPNLAILIITAVIITTSRGQGEEIPTSHSLDPGRADSDVLPTQGCKTLSARLHPPSP